MPHTGHLCKYIRGIYSITELTAAVTPTYLTKLLGGLKVQGIARLKKVPKGSDHDRKKS
jgi:hypothetical protein